jgi:RNA polymerase sigma factor (sigma-70 family)
LLLTPARALDNRRSRTLKHANIRKEKRNFAHKNDGISEKNERIAEAWRPCMPRTPIQSVIDRLRLSVAPEQTSDGILLDAFVRERCESSFAELVRRHGPMVWGVCCRLLPHRQDAEDCYQATFLVLVRKAHTVRPRSRIGAWLHGVAYHTALKARHLAAKRGHMEQQHPRLPEPVPQAATTTDLRQLVDRGLNELPEKYRTALILCALEGRAIKDVASELGCPMGTLAGWLARGRELLARRLAKHGVPAATAGLTAFLVEHASSAPPPLATLSASAPALALADATVRTLFLGKLTTWLVAATALVVALALGGVLYHALANSPPDRDEPSRRGDAKDKNPAAQPPPAPTLRFGWKAGAAYVYSVRVEVKSESGTAVLTSLNKYGVASVDSEDFARRQRGKLLALAESEDARSSCLILQSRVANIVGKRPSRDRRDELPFALANLATLTVLPNPEDGGTTWRARADCAVADGTSPKPKAGELPKRKPGPTTRDAGRAAEETSVFTLGATSGDFITIAKEYVLTMPAQDSEPRVEFRGAGAITFDGKAGLPVAMEFEGTLRKAGQPDTPIRVSYQLLEGAERNAALQAIHEAQPQATEESPQTPPSASTTGINEHPAWTDDLARMEYPEGAAAGRILGRAFKMDAAKLEPTGALTLYQSSDLLPDASIVIFLKRGEAIEDTRREIGKDTPAAQRLPIHLRCMTPGPNSPMASVFVAGYRMRLEFGTAKDGVVPGLIYVCLPDESRSVVAGAFTVKLK